ncbi:MAG: hypothetical protein QE485_04360 [Acidovorax sp.]|uniref:hypothetical protein n=1 Tax=Acidovorax sp. TaxID=1872122 RepID=UPI00261CC45E|nr:hypothetical protein [Acidovorax sp.]MDH4416436.1 hypothetical protein [Acidovorax sp.]
MAQQLIVGLIVAAAALYVLWRYLPARWRQGLGKVHPGLAQPPGCGDGDGDGGCGSCGGCGEGPDAGAEKPVAMPAPRKPVA